MQILRLIKRVFGLCEYEGCNKRSIVIADIKVNGKVLTTRHLCEAHKDIVVGDSEVIND